MSAADMSPTKPLLPTIRFRMPYAAMTLICLLVIWQAAVMISHLPEYLLPSPLTIITSLYNLSGLLVHHTFVTLIEVVLGFLIALAVAVPLATLICYSPLFERSIYPLIVGSQTIPKVAIAPLLLAAFGYGLIPKITIVALMAFFPIVINTVVGLRSVSQEMIYLAQSMGASPLQQFFRFRMPGALPSMFAGMKMASVLAVIGAVVAEFVGSNSGLGYVITVAGSNFRMDQQFAAIVVLSVLGTVIFWILGQIERSVLPWHKPTQDAA
ncbi:ABC transporter permease [Rhizobium halophytocola]|uniref:NitT/TauT family transport system permease protein n=1 Tax=Rhizobium halophytocola TaxID=735519 RepID=A0ABS4DU68_9HYPH|nr:ABC transporter permease [Rhizobium halophytocola]MBP1849215.1 NitT/TauT family transport system permease protein [Rhizobium halophytocola]